MVQRRFEVEQANRSLVEEERQAHKLRRDSLKSSLELHKGHGAALVAADRQQRQRVGAARKSLTSEHDAQGSDVVRQLHALRSELEKQQLAHHAAARRRVESTRHMQARSKQIVAGTKEANLKEGRGVKLDTLLLESVRDQAKQAWMDDFIELHQAEAAQQEESCKKRLLKDSATQSIAIGAHDAKLDALDTKLDALAAKLG